MISCIRQIVIWKCILNFSSLNFVYSIMPRYTQGILQSDELVLNIRSCRVCSEFMYLCFFASWCSNLHSTPTRIWKSNSSYRIEGKNKMTLRPGVGDTMKKTLILNPLVREVMRRPYLLRGRLDLALTTSTKRSKKDLTSNWTHICWNGSSLLFITKSNGYFRCSGGFYQQWLFWNLS